MNIDHIGQMWRVLKPNIEAGDLHGAAEDLVTYLVEECEMDPADINTVFRGDRAIKDAVTFYIETPDDNNYDDYSAYDDFEDLEDYHSMSGMDDYD